MKLIAAISLLTLSLFVFNSRAQETSPPARQQVSYFHTEVSNSNGLDGLVGRAGTVVGRVIRARMEQDRLLLVLDGGHVGILIGKGKPEGWSGKLIETHGLVNRKRTTSPEVPSLVIQQADLTTIRVFEESLATLSSVLIQEVEPNRDGRRAMPPLPVVSEAEAASAEDFRQLNSWKRTDGSVIKASFAYFTWRPRLAPDLKTRQWTICMGINGGQWKYPEDLKLVPGDEERLRRMLWRDYYQKPAVPSGHETLMVPRAPDPLVATADWLERLETWGTQPPVDDPALKRLPGPFDFGNLPDLRKLTSVELTKASPGKRILGKLQLVDWGMTGEATAEQITARIRWEDGLEETVPALTIFPKMTYRWGTAPDFYSANPGRHETCLLFMSDWAQARRTGQPLPGAELKLRAMRQFLHFWWGSTRISMPKINRPDSQKQHADREEIQKRSRLDQFGHKLTFPGLPPMGYKALPNDQADRSLLLPWQDELGGRGLRGFIPELACTLRWWADCKVIELPERMRDGKRRDTMLLAAVQRYPEAWKIQKLMLEESYAIQQLHDSDFSPANLARYAVGCHAVALDVDIWNKKKQVFRQRMLIHTAAPDGTVEFSIWGQKGSGRFSPVQLRSGGKRPGSAPIDVRDCYQLEILGSAELTDYLAKQDYRFVLDDWSMGRVTVMTPWIKDSSVPAGR